MPQREAAAPVAEGDRKTRCCVRAGSAGGGMRRAPIFE
jgi:hypothetical protein